MSNDIEIGKGLEGMGMGENGLGFTVEDPIFVDVGIGPKTGLQEGPDRRKGRRRKVRRFGTALPRAEAEEKAQELNDQKGFLEKLIPGRAKVVEDKGI